MSEPAMENEMYMMDPESYNVVTRIGLGPAELTSTGGFHATGVAIVFWDIDNKMHPMIFPANSPMLDYLISDQFRDRVLAARAEFA